MDYLAEYVLNESVKGKSRTICPSCTPHRRASHQQTLTLSLTVDNDSVLYYCHHCGLKGRTKDTPREIPRWKKPNKQSSEVSSVVFDINNLPVLQDHHVEFLESRGISLETAKKVHLFPRPFYARELKQDVDGIAFPYFKNDTPYSSKMRSIEGKYWSSSGNRTTFYGDWLINPDNPTLIFVEGEIDCLSMVEAGIENSVSVPDGAQSGTRCLPELHHLKNAKRIIIAVDNDDPGYKLREDLIRRIGKSKTWICEWPEGIKDANEYLVQFGAESLKEYVNAASPLPVDGLYEASDYLDRVISIFRGQGSKGYSSGLGALDDHYSIPMGFLTVVTGYPNHGKSELVDNIVLNLAEKYGMHTVLWSPENGPEIHVAKLIEKIAKRPFFNPRHPNALKESEIGQYIGWISEHFAFIADSDEAEATIESILDRAEAAIMRYGSRILVLDPYNQLVRPSSQEFETEWIRKLLIKLKKFAQNHDIHVILVAHPRKPPAGIKIAPPMGHDISSSAHWNNVTDFGITVFLSETWQTEVYIWKVRFKWHGKKGMVALEYDTDTGRFRKSDW
jgi:twinkle protein